MDTVVWIALITLVQSVVSEVLRKRGQMRVLRASHPLSCAICGARHFTSHNDNINGKG